MKVLLVEDEPQVRKIIGRILRLAGYWVVDVGSSQEALERVADLSFDLMITDQRMAGMSGDELVRELHGSGLNLPVLVISGSTAADLPDGVEFLAKPFGPDQLLTKLAAISPAC